MSIFEFQNLNAKCADAVFFFIWLAIKTVNANKDLIIPKLMMFLLLNNCFMVHEYLRVNLICDTLGDVD